MFYLHHKNGKSDTILFAGFTEPVYHKVTRSTGRSVTKVRQTREMAYMSQNRENDLNEQGDREKHVKTGRLPMQLGELVIMKLDIVVIELCSIYLFANVLYFILQM